jgi:ribosomal protein S18 acetylase RimI-like enzyme
MVRAATDEDHAFILEMARLACGLEGRHPVPAADDPSVLALLPNAEDVAVVALNDAAQAIGAAWCHTHNPPLLLDAGGLALPEVTLAVLPAARGRGAGAELLEAVADAMRARAPALSLNVHLLNPAVCLYIRSGFRVAGQGRGWYGVAMRRPLGE